MIVEWPTEPLDRHLSATIKGTFSNVPITSTLSFSIKIVENSKSLPVSIDRSNNEFSFNIPSEEMLTENTRLEIQVAMFVDGEQKQVEVSYVDLGEPIHEFTLNYPTAKISRHVPVQITGAYTDAADGNTISFNGILNENGRALTITRNPTSKLLHLQLSSSQMFDIAGPTMSSTINMVAGDGTVATDTHTYEFKNAELQITFPSTISISSSGASYSFSGLILDATTKSEISDLLCAMKIGEEEIIGTIDTSMTETGLPATVSVSTTYFVPHQGSIVEVEFWIVDNARGEELSRKSGTIQITA